jgi:hypothetical protein
MSAKITYGTALTAAERKTGIKERVYLDRSRVGSIFEAGDGSGFFYAPRRGAKGKTFPTVDAVKRSLEAI